MIKGHSRRQKNKEDGQRRHRPPGHSHQPLNGRLLGTEIFDIFRVTIKTDVVEEATTEAPFPPSEDDFQTINSEDDAKKIRNTSE